MHVRKPLRTATLSALVLLLPATIAAGGVLESRLAQNRKSQRHIKTTILRLDTKQQNMNRAITAWNSRINALNEPIFRLNEQIEALEIQVANRRNRIAELRRDFVQQKRVIRRLGQERDIAEGRLTDRVVEIYKSGDPGYAAWLVGAGDFGELADRQEVVGQVASLDSQIVGKISGLERRIRIKRARNGAIRARIASDIQALRADELKLEAARAQVVGKQDRLKAVQGQRQAYLARLRARERHLAEQYDQLDENSEAIREAIANGQTSLGASAPGGPTPSGIAWPVNGPVVSRFGPRWGRMHEGWDIAVPTGTPIHAAASGVVTYAGWMGGYGNLVIVQHGGSLSTAYAHQSRIGSSVGQFVSQGQVIGYIGCTGHCFGDHLHFETRINGGAVDPDNYL